MSFSIYWSRFGAFASRGSSIQILAAVAIAALLNGAASNEMNLPDSIDFTPFRDAITKAMKSGVQPKPLTNLSKSDECAMPPSSIMFSYTSHYTMDLIVLQHKAMESWGLIDCLESRFVTACLDAKCMAMCSSRKIPNCCLLHMAELPGSDFGKNAYKYFTYLKHELMFEALKVVEEVFFFDADTVIFRNPWVETQFGRNEQGQKFPSSYDIQYQRDRGRSLSCSGSVNSGQVRRVNLASHLTTGLFAVCKWS